MCIRDRFHLGSGGCGGAPPGARHLRGGGRPHGGDSGLSDTCLLYTSDAADERSSVDLGGRRIIKKKNRDDKCVAGTLTRTNRSATDTKCID